MSYVALYRKFRPATFDQVKGQDHIVRTLKNQIKNNRIGHAYLFTGTRGTGKTSVAKILAKAVNCLQPNDGEPCGVCENCLAAAQGTFMDIVEIDAASNTGVEDIRRVIEEIQYTPARGKYKVYIIDEVHMLSVNAFNAFLKTLEEPPEYVVFILATTEPHKLPQTILSRCQRYDFKRIDIDTITDNLSSLLKQEGIEAEEKAVRYVARAGDGSMRDALSLLDRCVAFSLGEKITYDSVLSILGTVDTEDFSALYRAVRDYQVADALKIIEKTVDSGKDLTPFISDFVMYLRNLLIFKVGGKSSSEILGISAENLKLLSEDAKTADAEILIRYIRILSELLNQIRFSPAKQILTEVAVIRLARPEMETGTEAMLDRIRRLEQQAQAQPFSAQPSAFAQAPASPQPAAHTPAAEEAPQFSMPEPPQMQPEPQADYTSVYEDPFSYAQPDLPDAYENAPAEELQPEPDLPGQQSWEAAPSGLQTKEILPEPAAAGNGNAQMVLGHWGEVLASIEERRIRSYLNKSAAKEENGAVTIYAHGEMAYKQLHEEPVIESIRQKILQICGVSVEVVVRHEAEQPEIPDQQDISSLFKKINMNIEMEDI